MNITHEERAQVLIQALPYIKEYTNKVVVIKYGGNAMIDPKLTADVMSDLVLLSLVGVKVVLVHGGGPDVSSVMMRMGKTSRFVDGLRQTDAETAEIVQMVLAGKTNKDLVKLLQSCGGKAIGLCGKDANLIEVTKTPPKDGVDLGYVGQVTRINVELLTMLTQNGYIPVIAPVGVGPGGESYNINADTVAGDVAAALKAEKLMFLTDIDGVRMDPENPDTLMSVISVDHIYRLIEQKVIVGGMIPKVMGCIKGIEQGVQRTHIVNGTIPHPIVLEIFTDKGIGTMVTR